MSFEITTSTKGNVIEARISGTITMDVYAQLRAATEVIIKRHRKIRILFDMQGFQGWGGRVQSVDIVVNPIEFSAIERVAVVRDAIFSDLVTVFCHPFRSAVVKFFGPEQIDAAADWLAVSV